MNKRVPQDLIPGLIWLLVSISNLQIRKYSICRIFADDISNISIFKGLNTSANELDNNLVTTDNMKYQQKTSLNLHYSRQVWETIFSRQVKKQFHSTFDCNEEQISQTFHAKLFSYFLQCIIFKVNKLLRSYVKLHNFLLNS